MSLAKANGVVISGVDAHIVEVEAHLSSGLPGMSIVGLADTAVGEARDRVRAAVLNSGAGWPQVRITVGLSPASLHKRGSGLDLAIASAILAADGQIPCEPLAEAILFGELGLDGRVRPVRGAVVAAVASRALRSARAWSRASRASAWISISRCRAVPAAAARASRLSCWSCTWVRKALAPSTRSRPTCGSAGPIRLAGGIIQARTVGLGRPWASNNDTNASPVASSVMACSIFRPGLGRIVRAAARSACT